MSNLHPAPLPLNPETFNPEQFAHELTGWLEAQLLPYDLSPEEMNSNLEIAYGFAGIAAGLLAQQPGFQPEPNSVWLTFDEEKCRECLSLFMEGVFHACVKAWEQQIIGEVKSFILKNLAQDVFLQAKQIIATTVGQELTPNVGFSDQQLKDWVLQAAESALYYYVSEYEKQYGSVQNQTILPVDLAEVVAQQQAAAAEAAAAAPEVLYQQPEVSPLQAMATPPLASLELMSPLAATAPSALALQSDSSLGSFAPQATPYDKWAAFALFISLLDEPTQQEWLNTLTSEQKEWVAYYSKVERIALELNVASVNTHLLALKDQILEARSTAPYQLSQTQQHLQQQLQAWPEAKLKQLTATERVGVQELLLRIHQSQAQKKPALMRKAPKLPLAIQGALVDYLSQS
jgi:hypothetical protein